MMEISGVNLASLGKGFSKLFTKGFEEVKPTYEQLVTIARSVTSQNEYAWLSNFPGMREWIGSRVLKELSGHSYSITNRDFESTVRVLSKDIEDDNIGLYSPMMEALGVEAAQHPDTLVWETLDQGIILLCYDGQPFFDEDHPLKIEDKDTVYSNYQSGDKAAWYLVDTTKPIKPVIFQMRKPAKFTAMTDPNSERVFMNREFVYGVDARYATGVSFPQLCFRSNAELNAENLEAAIQIMNDYKNEGGRKLGINPNLLIVGSSNQFKADKLLKQARLANGEENIHAGRLTVLVAPKLN